mmetsp:Transcript_8816/g.18277  ORF Transcript_8816/g.18277 Transcript_8816/m.18277 type:complete len:355 (-) Transcript_8816:471-1535(-)|eukprot:CAMPEP_0172442388 /NCGR_PEP_ID=MMETSP1065-20121228/2831_1 /TAXON_ID=265537 /ORGANISM="Amphiprora paludosa, Strain CCMP125" /LENGTH=354 /DNA_ID=CAMNT_0013192229 /DNA_START=901 /DNA_END=1965 /DNA_ORIENTATION=-
MRPKPSREWVMLELERLGVRVVSGRLGRKAGEEGDDPAAPQDKQKAMPPSNDGAPSNLGAVGGGGMQAGMQRSSSMGWGGSDADLTNLMARRNSSLGLSMMNDTLGRRGSLGSLGQVMGLEGDPTMPPHRPFVGGGAAAAYEAARHDHFTQKSAEQQRRASGLGLGSLAGGGLSGMGMSVNPNQHYEMLKLHHMNLLNEIQETTLMMNLYQQQQLQQQQQQLSQQASSDQLPGSNSDSQISMLMQQNGAGGQSMDNLFGANGQLQQRASLGLGASSQMGNFGGANGMSGGDLPGGLQQGSGTGMGDKGDKKAQASAVSGDAAKKRNQEGGEGGASQAKRTKTESTDSAVNETKD